jgi:hypothetical protein
MPGCILFDETKRRSSQPEMSTRYGYAVVVTDKLTRDREKNDLVGSNVLGPGN